MVNSIQYFSFLEKAIVNVLLKKRRSVILTTDNPALLSRAKVNILYSLFDPKISIFRVSVHHIFREREDQESGKLWWYHGRFFPDITWQVSKSLFYFNDIVEYSKYPDWVNNFNDNSWSKRLMWWHFIFNECSFTEIVRDRKLCSEVENLNLQKQIGSLEICQINKCLKVLSFQRWETTNQICKFEMEAFKKRDKGNEGANEARERELLN